ncbi:hypothetical protein PIB30_018582 [Stylosanthes scabra]|uniref:Pentatricopeptide repeat-containing protein n=1 Tax=Stylosanthes scabra TaxID=79078 RepID=A0ABU6R884_9FABA|nr:hypothetical protein [Stylosanthes scabra]
MMFGGMEEEKSMADGKMDDDNLLMSWEKAVVLFDPSKNSHLGMGDFIVEMSGIRAKFKRLAGLFTWTMNWDVRCNILDVSVSNPHGHKWYSTAIIIIAILNRIPASLLLQPPNPKPPFQLIHVSLQQQYQPPEQEEEAPSSFSNSARYVSLIKSAKSLDSCDSTSEQVSTILAALGDTIHEHDAVFVLNKMENSNTTPLVMTHFRDRIKPSKDNELILNNVTLKVCRKSMDFQATEKLFDEMLQRGLHPNNITFSTLINCARMCALPDKAVEWFEKI